MTEFNLNALQQAFPYTRLPFPSARVTGGKVVLPSGFEVSVQDTPEAVRQSVLGTPIFMPLRIDGFDFPNEPLVQISGSKSIVRTAVAGYSGTIKEDMGLNDYAITIRGIIVNQEADSYPEKEVKRLRDLVEKRESLEVLNPVFSLFNIDLIAIEDWSFPSIEGYQSIQPYELKGWSDRATELVISTDKDVGF